MTLVDTSVWIEHFRRGQPALIQLLQDGEVAMHPMILGELACGQLPQRASTLRLLNALPGLAVTSDAAVLHAIESRHWFGQGIGWIDAHLLSSALLAKTPLWTLDQRLNRVAQSSSVVP